MNAHVIEQLSAFLDGELDERERTAVARHLEACGECTGHLDELVAVDRLAASVTVEAPGGYFDGFASRVRDRIRKPARRRFAAPAWALTAAAVLLLAVTTPLLLRRQPDVAPADVPAAVALAPPPTMATAAPAATSPEKQDSLRARGSVGQDKRDDTRGVRAANEAPARTAPALKDEAMPHKKRAPGLAPPPAAPPPAAAEPAPSASADRPELEGSVLSETAPQQAERDAFMQEREQREESVRAKEQAEGAGFARAGTEAGASVAEAPRLALQETAPSAAFRALLERQAETIAEARGLREAWRAFVHGASETEADEARVRVIESGREAYRLSGERADLDLVRRDAAAYLKREDAHQAERVRALLRSLPR